MEPLDQQQPYASRYYSPSSVLPTFAKMEGSGQKHSWMEGPNGYLAKETVILSQEKCL